MAISFIAKANNSSGAATSWVVSKPTGTADGDVMIAFGVSSQIGVITKPTGWTLFDTQSPSSNSRFQIYWKLASGEGSSYTWSIDTSSQFALSILTYRGVDASVPIHATSTVTAGTTNVTTVTPTSATTSIPTLPLQWGWFDSSNSDTFTGASSGAGYTEREEVISPINGTFYYMQAVYESDVNTVAAGTISGVVITEAGSVNIDRWMGRIIALRPAILQTDLSVRASAIHRASRW